MDRHEKNQKSSIKAVNTGLIANFFLAILKSVIGITGRSQALLADGINSTSDVVYFIIVKIYMGLAGKPPDEEHPMGHRQLESISAIVVGAFVLTTAVAIFWDSVNKVYSFFTGPSGSYQVSLLALYTALATIIIKIVLTVSTLKIGKKGDNPAITAIGYDHRNDIFSASAAAIGIFLGRFGLYWVDPLAGAIVALIILKTGISIIRESANTLMTVAPTRKLSREIDETALAVNGVIGIENKSYHRYGPYMVLNLTINVDGNIPVNEGDRIATEVEEVLDRRFEFVRDIHIHYHPARKKT
ncbi:MAG: cation transporter [Spirochaetales bacterium]|nr:cation transporter [Spirochaetales bacterium]